MTSRQVKCVWQSMAALFAGTLILGCETQVRRLAWAEYQDRVYASWLGQCIGNMYGLPHEFKYNDVPRTEPIEGWAESSLDRIRQADGAFSDDDTDIEYVMLHCMGKYGPEPSYEQVAEFWVRHINDHIWVANRTARDLMSVGYLPPLTGRKELNPNWYQIDPQLVCEIWAVTCPGMYPYAAGKADWAARVTNDDYGTHPTIWYNVMYAAAFFEKDVSRLCQIGYRALPAGSVFRGAIDDVRAWKAELGDDWVAVRQRIKRKYLDRVGMPEDFATSPVGAILNGALGVLALLYGEGDFERTMNYACMAGYDADNQCATLAGLMGIIHGTAGIPRKYTRVFDHWSKPLNDKYLNRTRDSLPDASLKDMARRTADLGRQLIELHGGKLDDGLAGPTLVIPAQARFIPPLELRLMPWRVAFGEPVTIRPEVIGGRPRAATEVVLAGPVPPGLKVERQGGRLVLAGVPTRPGRYVVDVGAFDGRQRRQEKLTLIVQRKNLARDAAQVLIGARPTDAVDTQQPSCLRDGDPIARWASVRSPAVTTASSAEGIQASGANPQSVRHYYGYQWDQPVRLTRLVVYTGPTWAQGGWLGHLDVQFRRADGVWQAVDHVFIDPAYTARRARRGKQRFNLSFEAVTTTAIRVIGPPGGPEPVTTVAELIVPRVP